MTFARLLSDALARPQLPSTGDLLAIGLPLLRQLDDIHEIGEVSAMRGIDAISYDGAAIHLNPDLVQRPALNQDLDTLSAAQTGGPSIAPDYQAWEQLHDHHDVLTDIHLAGLILVSYAAGLDVGADPGLATLVDSRTHITRLNPTLHPVVADVISQMIEPDRRRRPVALSHVIARLENHRELPADLDLDEAYRAPIGWKPAILGNLRERVFDVSRRNRALYYSATGSSISLTEASMPLMVDVERVDGSQLFTWTGDVPNLLGQGDKVDLSRWCRFDEGPHIRPTFERLIASERKFRTEYGQGRLQLIVAFLRWFDPEFNESVLSPLLMMPAELNKRPGVGRTFELRVDPPLVVNPVLAHVLEQRFELRLPATVEATEEAVRLFAAELDTMVRRTAPGVGVALIDEPPVEQIRKRAEARVDSYRRRRATALASSGRWRQLAHSYRSDDFRPLGQALLDEFVVPAELPLRELMEHPDPPEHVANLADNAPPASNQSAGNQYDSNQSDSSQWSVDLCSVTLASLGTRRSTLARDYDQLLAATQAETTETGSVFDQLFSPDRATRRDSPPSPFALDLPLILPADDAQAAAIARAKSGESFIIQGPPGTGKSQTIANLIASYLAENKRVLFVCQKRAALDVVGHRLRQAGLGELVATIHDSQLDRRSFIEDLGATHRAWSEAAVGDAEADRGQALETARDLLSPLAEAMFQFVPSASTQTSLTELIERAVALRTRGIEPARQIVVDQHARPLVDIAAWLRIRPGLDRVVAALDQSGVSPHLGENSVLRLLPSALADRRSIRGAREFGHEIVAACDRLEEIAGDLLPETTSVGELGRLARALDDLIPLVIDGLAAVVDPRSAPHADLRRAVDELDRLSRATVLAAEKAGGWISVLSHGDTEAALRVARSKEGSTFAFLSRDWKRVRNLVEGSYDFSRHQIRPAITDLLSALAEWHVAAAGEVAFRQSSAARFGAADLPSLLAAIDRVGRDPALVAVANSNLDVPTLALAVADLYRHSTHLFLTSDPTVARLRQAGSVLASAESRLEPALVAWAALDGAQPEVLGVALGEVEGLDRLERSLLDATLASHESTLTTSSANQLDDQVRRLGQAFVALLEANGTVVVERARSRFAELVAQTDHPGMEQVRREVAKKTRFRSIRDLASDDTGEVVQRMRPVWLMSPLSVSDTLPLDEDLFDVVIFDEASQLTMEEAVPCLYRARQAIVVGDQMQLPPTRFFSTASDDDDEVVLDDEDQIVTVTLAADSFLTQANQSLGSSLLSWHYRSRSEALIAYSNHAFYNARLATIPDRQLPDRQLPDRATTGSNTAGSNTASSNTASSNTASSNTASSNTASSNTASIVVETADHGQANGSLVLDRALSFHRVENGVYHDRVNRLEADYIAELVRSILMGDDIPTIGVVAFSETQQQAISDALDDLASSDGTFARRLEEARDRTDDGEFVGLFVKNLENVQGDERDLIIMSVCYGPDPDGQIRMNFGPINLDGGEKRLNVIFSRAKRHMAVVSSIDGAQITNRHNDGPDHLARFLEFAAAESRGDSAMADEILEQCRPQSHGLGERPDTSAHRSAIATEISAALRDQGWQVDLDVGRSIFTIDLAVRGPSRYQLGVLIDPGPGLLNPASRFVAEAGVLAAFDWPLTRISASEWWTNPDTVLERIVHMLERGQ